MRIIDITRPLSEKTVSFPGDPPPQFSQRDAGVGPRDMKPFFLKAGV